MDNGETEQPLDLTASALSEQRVQQQLLQKDAFAHRDSAPEDAASKPDETNAPLRPEYDTSINHMPE